MPLKRSFFPFRTVHVSALVLCTVFLPWSTAFLSMAQMLLAANWFAEGFANGTMKERLRSSFTTAPPLVLVSFLLLHVLRLHDGERLVSVDTQPGQHLLRQLLNG